MDRREYDIMVSKLTHEGPMPTIKYTVPEEITGADNAKESVSSKAEVEAAVVPEVAASEPGIPVMYVKDHCPKCKGAEQRFKLAKVQYSEVNCSENMDIARELGIQQTPTIIDPDGTRYVGDNAAAEWLKAHSA